MKAAETSQTICQNMVFVFLEAHHILYRTRGHEAWQYTHDFISLIACSFPPFHFFSCIWSSSKLYDLLMPGLLSWKVVFKCEFIEKNSVIKHQPELLLWAILLPPPQRGSIFKKLFLVVWRTVKLLKAGRHHRRSDKDQETWLRCDLCCASTLTTWALRLKCLSLLPDMF